MSNQLYYPTIKTQGSQDIILPVSLSVPTLAAAPIFGEGNPTGQSTGPYLSAQRGATGAVAAGFTGPQRGPTGMTGVVLLRTRDTYPGVVAAHASITPPEGTNLVVEPAGRIQMSDYTWMLAFNVINPATGVKTDPPVGSTFDITMIFRDTKSSL